TSYQYDALNRRTYMQDAATNVTTTQYDKAGNVTTVTDPRTNTTTYQYDKLNRQTAVIDARSFTTTTQYDAVGNVTQVKDASTNVTTFGYDVLNRKTLETNPLGNSATFAYDAAGNQTSVTDRLGRVRTMNYDVLNRLTTQVWSVSGTAVKTLTYSFDPNGNMLTAANNISAYTMAYDALNRVTAVQEPFGQSLTFAYDAVGNRTQVQDSKGGTTTTVYDTGNRLVTVLYGGTGPTPLRPDFTYTATTQISTTTRYSSLDGTTKVTSASYAYDQDNRLTNLEQFPSAGGTALSNLTYTYDPASNVQTEVYNGATTTYVYDAINE